jgi:hypothetical protein
MSVLYSITHLEKLQYIFNIYLDFINLKLFLKHLSALF